MLIRTWISENPVKTELSKSYEKIAKFMHIIRFRVGKIDPFAIASPPFELYE